ncbi:MAG: T9SS type A sorting domain-containing protein [Bacteroidia bacterium]
MKKFVFFLLTFIPGLTIHAQTAWELSAEDAQSQKLNAIESNEDGSIFQLRFVASTPAYTYSIETIDSTGAATYSSTFCLPDSGFNHKVVSFQADTVMNRLVVISQYEDSTNFYMHMLVLNFYLTPQDSMHYGVSKSNADQFSVKGGGMDYAFNKFIVYNYRDAGDQIWTRGLARKTLTGSTKSNSFKAGQASNDGIFINTCTVMPTGFIYIGGARKESLYGNYIFLEKINSSLVTLWEVKDQIIPNNTFTNHVSSIHVYSTASNSQILVGGTIYGLAPGDTVIRSHGFMRAYNSNGTLKWNHELGLVRDYKLVMGKNGYAHGVGSNNGSASGLDIRITRLFYKDGVLSWARYYGNRSAPISLDVERDGSLLICGDRNSDITLANGTTKTVRSYMLVRYSKFGKRLFDYNYPWSIQPGVTYTAAALTDVATGRSGFYYAAGWERTAANFSGTEAYFDSVRTIQFNNGALRTTLEEPPSEKLLVRPNPAQNEVSFESEFQILDFIIADAKGSLTSLDAMQQDGATYRCDISSLKPGLYILKVRTERGWKTARFIKE